MYNLKIFIKKHPILLKYTRLLNCYLNNFSSNRIIKGKSNKIKIHNSAIKYKFKLDLIGNNNVIEIGELSSIKNTKVHIRGNNNIIKIEDNVSFSNTSSLWIEDNNCVIHIMNSTTFESVHIAATENNSKIIIGKDCMFAYNIDIRTGDSHSIIDNSTNQRINYAKNVNIGNHVWVASHVSILKGVSIPSNSVVATRSVVTKVFNTENVIIGGSPAIILNEDINWLRERLP